MEGVMLGMQVSFGWVLVVGVIGPLIGFWGARYWRKKDPESYESAAGAAKDAGDRIRDKFDR
jgi:hypothetical protein